MKRPLKIWGDLQKVIKIPTCHKVVLSWNSKAVVWQIIQAISSKHFPHFYLTSMWLTLATEWGKKVPFTEDLLYTLIYVTFAASNISITIITTPWREYYYFYSPSTDEETKAQKIGVISSEFDSKWQSQDSSRNIFAAKTSSTTTPQCLNTFIISIPIFKNVSETPKNTC